VCDSLASLPPLTALYSRHRTAAVESRTISYILHLNTLFLLSLHRLVFPALFCSDLPYCQCDIPCARYFIINHTTPHRSPVSDTNCVHPIYQDPLHPELHGRTPSQPRVTTRIYPCWRYRSYNHSTVSTCCLHDLIREGNSDQNCRRELYMPWMTLITELAP
jgi:hypothetical protein